MEEDTLKLDKYIESMRNIQKRIKSCISCNKSQCPHIRERLHQHRLSHPSSLSRSHSSQHIKFLGKSSGVIIPSSDVKLNIERTTSTSELNGKFEMEKKTHKNEYKDALRDIINEWSKDLKPTNRISETEKQNMINELLENIYHLSLEIYDKYYGIKIKNEIDEFFDTRLFYNEGKLDTKALKESLVGDIHDLNEKMINTKIDSSKFNREISNNNFDSKDFAANRSHSMNGILNGRTEQSYLKTTNGSKQMARRSSKTQDHSSSKNGMSSYDNIYENIMLSRSEFDNKDSKFIHKTLAWVSNLNEENYLNIDTSNEKYIIDDLLGRLKPFLEKKTLMGNDKLLLRGEILNFLLDNMNVTKSNENIAGLNKLANKLALDLLIENTKQSIVNGSPYSTNDTQGTYFINIKKNWYHEEIFYDAVVNSLENFNICSDYLISNIVICLLENMDMLNTDRHKKIQLQLFSILQQSTNLSDCDIADIVGTIIKDVKQILENNKLINYEGSSNEIQKDKILPMYKSEINLNENYNYYNFNNIRKKSNFVKEECFSLKSEDNNYIDKVSNLLAASIGSLPIKLSGKSKTSCINNLDSEEGNSLTNNKYFKNLTMHKETCTHRCFDIEMGYGHAVSQLSNNVSLRPVKHKETQNFVVNMVGDLAKARDHQHSCCSKILADHKTKRDIGSDIIKIIETWCSNLPIESNNEVSTNNLKDHVAIKLFQKVGELNMNPKYFNDDALYRNLLREEIEQQLENLPQTYEIQNAKNGLVTHLLDDIYLIRNEIKESASGAKYKSDLEKTIESSMPYPVLTYQEVTPGFKIYKNHLASLFILENFDQSNDAAKLNYEMMIKHELDKYFEDVQKRNAVTVTKDQVYNELYSALYSVPSPKESAIAEEVEIIKTKCDIRNWFQTLPLKEASSEEDRLERDQILDMLAKRLHEMEKYEPDPNEKMHKEITKWLSRLPLLHGNNPFIDNLAYNLQTKLKETLPHRQCVSQRTTKGNLGSSQIAGTSNVSSSIPLCCQLPSQKPVDMILEFVEKWCQQLPISTNTLREKEKADLLKGNLAIKIFVKMSELAKTVEHEFLYETLLDDEIDNLLTSLPQSRELIETKEIRKQQLMDAIKSVKPLIEEEKARYEYKREIKNTVSNVLKVPSNKDDDKSVIVNSISEEIVDDFIMYNYHRNDKEGPQFKRIIQNKVENIISLVRADKFGEMTPDSLVKSNQLLCELSKIPPPGESAIQQEMQEIAMKFKISNFLNELSLPDDLKKIPIKDQVKATLARRLSDYEKLDTTIENLEKMRTDVTKYIKKIDENVDIGKIDSFIKSLKEIQSNRKPILNHNINGAALITPSLIAGEYMSKAGESSFGVTEDSISNQNKTNEQWLSLSPLTPVERKKELKKPEDNIKRDENIERSFEEPATNCQGFEREPLLSSCGPEIQLDQLLQPRQRDRDRFQNHDRLIPRQEKATQSQNQIVGRDKLNQTGPVDQQLKDQMMTSDTSHIQTMPQINSKNIALQSGNISQSTQGSNTQYSTEEEKSRPCLISCRIPSRLPCRRPSLTIFCPSYLEPEQRNQSCTSKEEIAEEGSHYSCVSRGRQQNWCPIHRKLNCKCCNRVNCETNRNPNSARR